MGESILNMSVVSTGIYFIQDGKVEVYARDQDMPIILYDAGSYFGDSSFIYKIRNQYGYYFKSDRIDN